MTLRQEMWLVVTVEYEDWENVRYLGVFPTETEARDAALADALDNNGPFIEERANQDFDSGYFQSWGDEYWIEPVDVHLPSTVTK